MNEVKQEAHVEAYTRDLATQIFAKAMEVSTPDYSVFVNYSPHIDGINVRIFNNGWLRDSNDDPLDPDYDMTVYMDWDDAHQNLSAALEMIGKRDLEEEAA